MPKVRIIKRTDGVIQTQHRPDERYDASTLPSGTSLDDVDAETLVEADELLDVEDVQTQLNVVDGRLVKDLSRKALTVELGENRSAAEAILQGLEEDDEVPRQVKRYLAALRDYLNIGPGRRAHPGPPAMDLPANERRGR